MRLFIYFKLWVSISESISTRHGYTPLDEARDNDNEATLKVLEAEVARRQQELNIDKDDDDNSDDTSSSSPMEDEQDVDMQLTDGDHWCVSVEFHTSLCFSIVCSE